MKRHQRNAGRVWLALLTAIVVLPVGPAYGVEPRTHPEFGALTFFGWSDQHIQTDGDGSHLEAAIDAMNTLPETEYPPEIGGEVAKPEFVFGCGDITEWPTRAARDTYDRLLRERLSWPSRDILGNHDEGGKAPSRTMMDWQIARHGALSYTFQAGGVHFLAVFSKYDESLNNPAQPLTNDALAWLRAELHKIPAGAPVIVATHLCYDALTNRDALIDALGDTQVLMVLGGHYHKSKVDRYRGIDFVQLPSPAPKNSAHEVTVVRITPDRVIAVPYNYQRRAWTTQAGKVLDKRGSWAVHAP